MCRFLLLIVEINSAWGFGLVYSCFKQFKHAGRSSNGGRAAVTITAYLCLLFLPPESGQSAFEQTLPRSFAPFSWLGFVGVSVLLLAL